MAFLNIQKPNFYLKKYLPVDLESILMHKIQKIIR